MRFCILILLLWLTDVEPLSIKRNAYESGPPKFAGPSFELPAAALARNNAEMKRRPRPGRSVPADGQVMEVFYGIWYELTPDRIARADPGFLERGFICLKV